MSNQKQPRDPSPDEAHWLIMAPYRGPIEIGLYPDSRIVRANCGHLTWLSPQGESYVERAYTVCEDCAADIIENDTDEERVAVKGALAHIAKHHGHQGVDVALDYIQRHGITPQG